MDERPEPDEPVELDLLRSAKPELLPRTSTIHAHREALAQAMHRGTSPLRLRRLALRQVAVAAAAIPVLAGAAFLASRSPGENQSGGGPNVELASSSAFYGAPRCGDDPPPDLTIPDGFRGPIDGPSEDSETAAAPDQLVRHWTSDSATIELRWYADPTAVPPPSADHESLAALDRDGFIEETVSGRKTLSSGRAQVDITMTTAPGDRTDPCTWAQVAVVHDDIAQAVQTFNTVFTGQACISLGDPTDRAVTDPCVDGRE